MFYLIANSPKERDDLIGFLVKQGIIAIFHYLPLHNSPYYVNKHGGRDLPHSIRFSKTLIRLPLYVEMTSADLDYIITNICLFFGEQVHLPAEVGSSVTVKRIN
jgi:dTDP-4-amino-4,6-dideoxygalactose transaminase